jgi:hypothetical protein
MIRALRMEEGRNRDNFKKRVWRQKKAGLSVGLLALFRSSF